MSRASRVGAWMGGALLCVGLGGAGWVLASGVTPDQGTDEETRRTMQGIFVSVREVFPLSMAEARFRDPAHRERILASLRSLSENASTLVEHGRGHAAGFEFVGRSLAHGAQESLRRYERGDFEEARFLAYELTESCIACHSRLPDPGPDSPLPRDFVKDESFSGLGRVQMADLLLATRQFDAALAKWEELFAARDENPATMLGPLTDYLVVSIRVKRDFERPVPVLRRLVERPDLWRHLRSDVEFWIRSLPALAQGMEPATVASARKLLKEARRVILFPADRRALVHYVAASAILNGYIESRSGDGRDLAEAYYLLGVTESRIGRAYWIGQPGFYLETAIRRAPGEPFAEHAYALLEEEVVLEYTYNDGVHIPEDIAERLAELRDLIDTKQASPSR